MTLFSYGYIEGTGWFVIYLLWITGLLGFFLLAMHPRDPVKIAQELMEHWIGRLMIIWMTSSLVGASLAWPLLLAGPVIIVTQAGAPVNAGIISAAYAIFIFFIIWKLIEERLQQERITYR